MYTNITEVKFKINFSHGNGSKGEEITELKIQNQFIQKSLNYRNTTPNSLVLTGTGRFSFRQR
ncbi:hypothetical protein HanRHA438_Chr08g0345121 [Helianthus annuus]|nr:hypothetical protein HanRHA438_Chr08g0345121 [Helianthus annuus]